MIAVIGKNVPWPAATDPRMQMGGGRGQGAGKTELGGSQCPHNEEGARVGPPTPCDRAALCLQESAPTPGAGWVKSGLGDQLPWGVSWGVAGSLRRGAAAAARWKVPLQACRSSDTVLPPPQAV